MFLAAFLWRFETMVDKDNTVIIIVQADHISDIGPDDGKKGGQVVFCGTLMETITADYLRREYGQDKE